MRHHVQNGSYSRLITPAEWLYLGMGGQSDIQFVLQGDGSLRPQDLTAAVVAASEASPGTRLVRDGRRWVDTGIAPAVRVLEADSFDRARLDSPALRDTLTGSGATFEVLLFPGTPATVVFRAGHAVADGTGLRLWATDVFRVLRGEQPLGALSRLNSEEFLEQLLPEGLPPIPPAAGKLEWAAPLGRLPKGPRGPLWRHRSVDGRHPAATAKVLAALAAGYGPGGAGLFFVPVDMRRHDPGLRSTAWLSQALKLNVQPGDGWEKVHHDMLSALAERKELELRTPVGMLRTPLPLVRLISSTVDRSAVAKDQYSALAFTSHLGTFEPAEFSTPGFRATTLFSLSGTGPGTPPAIELLEGPDRTEVSLTWFDGPGVAERAEQMLDVVEEALSPRANRNWPGNATDRALPSTDSVVRLFREQVGRTPHRTALSGPEGKVSYAELSRRADGVAAELRRLGVGAGTVVGLLADRSVAAVAGVWGVLRAGACYLPLDARHPDVRLAGLLEDAGAAYCLVQRPYQDRDCVPAGCEPLILDDLAADPAPGEPAVFQDAEVAADDLAYVIYTSGSTGKPKGVQIEHGSLLNYVHWGTREFDFDSQTRLPLLTSPSFDVSGTSIFLPLLTGGEVILMRDDPNHLSLRRLLEHSGANALNLTPAHLDLIGQLDLSPAGFRSVVVVGEQLRVEVAARAQEMFGPKCRIINLYGPTEATIGCTTHTFQAQAEADAAVVPIGVPADNTTVFLLDDKHRFVAPGEVGEMYLGGVQLARGYRGRPDLDLERFPRLADGTRVYRTGDLARVMDSGELEFIGRIDDQVKVRGHRVEPAEVAQAIEEHPSVDRAVVVARSRAGQAGKALFGYVLVNSEVTGPELAEFVGNRLPAYMVPSVILVVPELPYTMSGKIDVKALPDPFADVPSGQSDTPAPAGGAEVDPVEEAVAQVWARVLGIDRARLDAKADFHRLGGDSLAFLAMLAGVGREVLAAGREDAFMADLAEIIGEATLEHVAALAGRAGVRVRTEAG